MRGRGQWRRDASRSARSGRCPGTAPVAAGGMAVKSGRLIVEPRPTRRYKLDELLAQCNRKARRGKEDREWLDSGPVGRELHVLAN